MNLKRFFGSSVIGLNFFLIYYYVGVTSDKLSIMVEPSNGAMENYIRMMKTYRKGRRQTLDTCFACCKLKILLK